MVAHACLLGLVLCMPLVPHGGSISIAKHCVFLALATLGATALWIAAWRNAAGPRLSTGVDRALFVYFAAAVPAAWFARNGGIAMYTLGLLSAHALTYVLAAGLLTDAAAVRRVALAALGAGCVVAVVGLGGYASFVAADLPEQQRTSWLATPFFRHSYLAAQYVVMVVVGAIVWLLERGKPDRTTLIVALAASPMVAFLVVIGSRAAYLAVAVALLVELALRGSRATRAGLLRGLVGVAGCVGLLLVIVPGALEFAGFRIASVFHAPSSTNSFARVSIWLDTLRMVADHPLFGVGPGGFDTAFPRYHAAWPAVPHAHNQFLQDLAELGVVGLVALLLVFRVALRTIGARMREFRAASAEPIAARATGGADESSALRPLFHAAVAALAACATYFLFETPMQWPEAGTLALVALAVVARTGRSRVAAPARPRFALAGIAALAVALVVIGPSWVAHARAATSMASATALLASADAARTRGESDLANQLRERALDRLEHADAAFPWKTAPLVLRAEHLLRLGRFEEALEATRIADLRSPAQLDVLTRQALALMQLGRHEQAIVPLRRAIVAHHGHGAVEASITLGRAYAALGRHEEALRVFDALIDPRVHLDVERPALLLDAARARLALRRDLDVAAELVLRHQRRASGGPDATAAAALARDIEAATNADCCGHRETAACEHRQ